MQALITRNNQKGLWSRLQSINPRSQIKKSANADPATTLLHIGQNFVFILSLQNIKCKHTDILQMNDNEIMHTNSGSCFEF